MSNLRYRNPKDPEPDEDEFESPGGWWAKIAGPASVFLIVAVVSFFVTFLLNFVLGGSLPGLVPGFSPFIGIWLGLTVLGSALWFIAASILGLLTP